MNSSPLKKADNLANLIVPLNIEALCIGEKDAHLSAQFTPMTIDYSRLPYRNQQSKVINQTANISENFVHQPFQGDTLLEKGVHLHWALPDALTRGSIKQGNMSFPLVPNRWLVTRLLTLEEASKKLKLDIKSWVIESDKISWERDEEFQSTLIPYKSLDRASHPKPFAYLGKTFKGTEWEEDHSEGSYYPLTAIGPGEPDFAAFYPKSRGVFGFYDALKEDIFNQGTKTQLTYVVVGWYSDLKEDCLQKAQSLSTLLKEYNWSLSELPPDKLGATLFHGVVKEVDWASGHSYLDQVTFNPTVAIGNTTTEALSALLSNGDPIRERLLNALQLGLLNKLDQPDGTLLLEEALHQSYFNSVDSGKLWTLETINPQDEKTPTEKIPSIFLERLADLNICQTDIEKIDRHISALRWQIFADWYKYMAKEHPHTGEDKDAELVDVLIDYIQEEEEKLKSFLSEKLEKEKVFQQVFENLQTQIKDLYTLKDKASSRFWQPQDPVVLLKGEGVKPALRYGGDGRFEEDGTLKCRLIKDVITDLNIKANAIEDCDSYTLKTQEWITSFSILNSPLSTSCKLLLSETLLLTSQFTALLMQDLLSLGGAKNPAVQNADRLKTILCQAQTQALEGKLDSKEIEFVGVAPSPVSFHTWKQPWLPILLQWQVRYYPVYGLDDAQPGKEIYPKEIIKTNFSLEESDFDLNYKGETPLEFHEYTGEAYLTPGAQVNLKNQIEKYFPTDKEDEELKWIKKEIEGLSVLSQSLDGFNAALLMQKKTIQFKVHDPISPSPSRSDFTNKLVNNAVQNANSVAPESFNSFSPVRGGFLEIVKLRVIDTYGRFKDIKPTNLIKAHPLEPPKRLGKPAHIYLPARFSQPCQLDFKLLPALNAVNKREDLLLSNPIGGWILANPINRSLMVFAPEGIALGSLVVSGDGLHIHWQGVPGKDTAKKPIEQALEGVNVHFKDFILSIYKNEVSFFREFIRTLERSIDLIEPANFQNTTSVATLFGRPLAVVRSYVGLTLQGPAMFNQGWPYFERLASDNRSPELSMGNHASERSTGGIRQIEMPVRMGDSRKINDGLIGFYIESQDPHYTHFYASVADNRHASISKPDEFTLSLNAEEKASSTLLMIVDPRASIHVSTGILPTKAVEIPALFYKEAMQNFEITFLTAPVLSDSQAITLPIPMENGLEWIWLQNKEGEWKTSPTIEPTVENANFNFRSLEVYEGWLKLVRAYGDKQDESEKI